MKLGLFGLELQNLFIQLSLLRRVNGLDLFKFLLVHLNLFLQTGNSKLVLGDQFVPVLDGVDLHGGQVVVWEL
jgi:hypothetical protein